MRLFRGTPAGSVLLLLLVALSATSVLGGGLFSKQKGPSCYPVCHNECTPYQTCQNVPYTTQACRVVSVPQTQCNMVPFQHTVQRCNNVIRNIPQQVCQPVCQQVPVVTEVPVLTKKQYVQPVLSKKAIPVLSKGKFGRRLQGLLLGKGKTIQSKKPVFAKKQEVQYQTVCNQKCSNYNKQVFDTVCNDVVVTSMQRQCNLIQVPRQVCSPVTQYRRLCSQNTSCRKVCSAVCQKPVYVQKPVLTKKSLPVLSKKGLGKFG